jgi:type II secretory pathway pseudopilin PulG
VTLIISAALFTPGAQTDKRALYKACLQMQADIREAQRRAVLEGKKTGYAVSFWPTTNSYKLYATMSKVDKSVELDSNVSFTNSVGTLDNINVVIKFGNKDNILVFEANGRPEAGGTIYLKAGRFWQEITVEVTSGRVEIKEMK